MSVGHTPHAATFTSNSPGPMRGTGTVSTRRSFTPRYTTARIVFGIAKDIGEILAESMVLERPDAQTLQETVVVQASLDAETRDTNSPCHSKRAGLYTRDMSLFLRFSSATLGAFVCLIGIRAQGQADAGALGIFQG